MAENLFSFDEMAVLPFTRCHLVDNIMATGGRLAKNFVRQKNKPERIEILAIFYLKSIRSRTYSIKTLLFSVVLKILSLKSLFGDLMTKLLDNVLY